MNLRAIKNSPNFNARSRRRAAPNLAKSAGNDADKNYGTSCARLHDE
jgi:hypothetical protein